MNGIEDIVGRADLADRGVFLTLAPIGEQQRRPETELWRELGIARPRILGALLDGAVRGLQTLPGVRLTSLPRMADFALWATACETALWPAGTFARAYAANRQAAVEGHPVAICVCRLMAQRVSWAGTASDLLRAAMTKSRKTARTGQKIPAPSLGAYAVRRRFFARWALKFRSAARGERGPARSP